MSKDLRKQKVEVEWVTLEEHRDAAEKCRDGTEEAKAQVELKSVRDLKGVTSYEGII